jgi:Domain of unknown function (DUF4345)
LLSRRYLLFSASGLLVIALGYGIAPAAILPRVLDVTVNDRDLRHVFRAVMGLYLAFSLLWAIGAFVPRYTRTALVSEVVFMAGLACGRILSLFTDGRPSNLLTIYLILEIVMAAAGIGLLRRQPVSPLPPASLAGQ